MGPVIAATLGSLLAGCGEAPAAPRAPAAASSRATAAAAAPADAGSDHPTGDCNACHSL
jgi:hypothetical protein